MKKNNIVRLAKSLKNISLRREFAFYEDDMLVIWWLHGDPVPDVNPELEKTNKWLYDGLKKGHAEIGSATITNNDLNTKSYPTYANNGKAHGKMGYIIRVQDRDLKYREWIYEATGIEIAGSEYILRYLRYYANQVLDYPHQDADEDKYLKEMVDMVVDTARWHQG